LLQQVNGWRNILFWGRLRRSSSGGCAAYMYYYVLWLADFCIFLFTFYYYTVYCLILCIACLILCTAWYWLLLIYYRQTSAFLTYIIILLCIDYHCLTLPDAACSQTTTGHSALRTMWLSAPVLAYVPVDVWLWLRAPPQPLNARVGVWHLSGWLIRGNRRTCSHGLVRSLLSGSDGLWCEESDHINVLGIQAASKPH
jgi:hypothetical protein